MFVTEKYVMLKSIDHLIKEGQADIRFISEQRNVFILERYEKQTNTSHVIMFQHKQFDWSNHLKRDFQQNVQYLDKNIRMLRGRKIHYHVVYVANLAPVDEWKDIRTTKQIKGAKNIHTTAYYLSEEDRDEELQRLSNYVQLDTSITITSLPTHEEQEQQSLYLEQKLYGLHRKKEREFKQVFHFGKTRVTFVLIALNLVIFALLERNGSSTDTFHLIDWGAKFNPAIANGEWWRIITSMFLHIGALHLFMNMLALFFLGDVAEKIYGTKRFLFIYFTAGVFGGVASFATNDAVAAGASGAIFGLFGALLFFGVHYRDLFFKTIGSSLLIIVAINIVFGFTIPQIDNGAHLGGLIGGFFAAQIVHLPKKKDIMKQVVAIVIIVISIVTMGNYGVKHAESSEDPQTLALIAQQYINDESYSRVENVLTDAIEQGIEHEYLYFYRSVALIELDELERAEEDLKKAIELNEYFSEAYYNLGVLYEQKGDIHTAIDHVKRALEIRPDDEQFNQYYEQLIES
ncbi:rhomboid family intramembrane serine protease [Alkalibacillus aidingensis]|uniref:rhomboid family intramembrane serine protease n=1 Tax=Alkalibacillus aidingensis TaxID=2747607 RepID=UPI0016609E52|nr:rhomboid family intramembrane serine protease [Alkalibacillus aidingensis]